MCSPLRFYFLWAPGMAASVPGGELSRLAGEYVKHDYGTSGNEKQAGEIGGQGRKQAKACFSAD
jgi:hypothetical protein